MARTDNFTNFATDVADSIREMTGKTDKIPASEFDTEIRSIQTNSGPTLTKNVYLIKDGIEQTDFTEGSEFIKLEGTDEGTLINGDGYLGICVGLWANWRIRFNRKFNFSKFKKIYIDYAFPKTNNTTYKQYIGASFRVSTDDNEKYVNDSYLVGKTTERTIVEYNLADVPDGKISLHGMNLAGSNYKNYPLQLFNVYFEIDAEYQDKVVEITENGTQTILPDTEYAALNSVEVTTNVTMANSVEKTYAILNGIDQSEFTGGHTFTLVDATGPVKEIQNDGYISLAVKRWGRAEFVFNNSFDLSKYDRVMIDYAYPVAFGDGLAAVSIGFREQSDRFIDIVSNGIAVPRTTVSVDLSDFNTVQKVLINVLNLADINTYQNYPFNLYNMWFEKDIGQQRKTIEITENGTYNITADEGYYALKEVEAVVNVPSEFTPDTLLYTELEYLETQKTLNDTGNTDQYLLTDYKLNNNSRIVLKFSRDVSTFGGSMFGVFNETVPTIMFGYHCNGTHRNRFEMYWGNPFETYLVGDTGTIKDQNDFIIDLNKNVFTVYKFDNSVIATKTFSNSTFETPYTTPIMAARVRTDGVNNNGCSRLYSCQIYDNDVLIYDIIPVKDPDGVVCGYNKVDGTFMYNAGTGANFTAGPVVREVKYEYKRQDKTVEITENGTQTILPDKGYSDLKSVEIVTNVPSQKYAPTFLTFDSYKGTDLQADVNGLDTSKMVSMYKMFNNAIGGPTTLDLSHFKTSNVTSTVYMFWSYHTLTSLILNGFDTSNVTNMSQMFRGCSSLMYLDIRTFTFDNVTSSAYIFDGIPADCEIIVKDDTAKQWVLKQRETLTNVKTVAELE